ncbi:Uncharacterized protein TCM_044548 [Theobroma cacao]|uniref:RNase H type-1 domain-containing protein n=1 Tax=Theobroma cacao TaxID=3641 RepID=A0A061FQ37_THECC|nr:Uncharacterized protein TCM_044548 [Theobroma cacao]
MRPGCYDQIEIEAMALQFFRELYRDDGIPESLPKRSHWRLDDNESTDISKPIIDEEILDQFCKASGQKVSLAKSRILFSSNVCSARVNLLSNTTKIPLTMDSGKYLGASMIHGRITRETYSELVFKFGWPMSYKNVQRYKAKLLAASMENSKLKESASIHLRNLTLFDAYFVWPHNAWQQIWTKAKDAWDNLSRKHFRIKKGVMISWKKPKYPFVKLNVDESAKGQPVMAAASGVIRDENGNWGFRKVQVESDSLLAIQKLTNQSSPLDPECSSSQVYKRTTPTALGLHHISCSL